MDPDVASLSILALAALATTASAGCSSSSVPAGPDDAAANQGDGLAPPATPGSTRAMHSLRRTAPRRCIGRCPLSGNLSGYLTCGDPVRHAPSDAGLTKPDGGQARRWVRAARRWASRAVDTSYPGVAWRRRVDLRLARFHSGAGGCSYSSSRQFKDGIDDLDPARESNSTTRRCESGSPATTTRRLTPSEAQAPRVHHRRPTPRARPSIPRTTASRLRVPEHGRGHDAGAGERRLPALKMGEPGRDPPGSRRGHAARPAMQSPGGRSNPAPSIRCPHPRNTRRPARTRRTWRHNPAPGLVQPHALKHWDGPSMGSRRIPACRGEPLQPAPAVPGQTEDESKPAGASGKHRVGRRGGASPLPESPELASGAPTGLEAPPPHALAQSRQDECQGGRGDPHRCRLVMGSVSALRAPVGTGPEKANRPLAPALPKRQRGHGAAQGGRAVLFHFRRSR